MLDTILTLTPLKINKEKSVASIDTVWFHGKKVDAAFLGRNYEKAKDEFQTTQIDFFRNLPQRPQDKDFELDEETGTGEILSDPDDAGKERPWRMHKRESVSISKLYEKAREKEASILSDSRFQALQDCASSLVFLADSEGKKRLKTANFCRVRLCPMCSWRRSMKLFGQTSQVAARILEKEPSTRFLFLTLTIKNCKADELTEQLKKMDNAFKYIVSAGQTFAPAKAVKKNLLGYMRALEITYNQKADTYHPHFHVILAMKSTYFKSGEYINHAGWREIWKKACKLDYDPEIRLEAIKSEVKNGMAGAVAEASKYPVKPTAILDITDEGKAVDSLILLTHVMANRRMITFGGIFKKIRAELKLQNVESENADLKNTEQDDEKSFEPVKMIFFKWRVKVGAYIC